MVCPAISGYADSLTVNPGLDLDRVRDETWYGALHETVIPTNNILFANVCFIWLDDDCETIYLLREMGCKNPISFIRIEREGEIFFEEQHNLFVYID